MGGPIAGEVRRVYLKTRAGLCGDESSIRGGERKAPLAIQLVDGLFDHRLSRSQVAPDARDKLKYR